MFLLGRDQFAKGQWALLYLLVILLVASAAGPGPAVLAAVLAFFAWNFFFLPPYHTLQIHDPKDWLSLVAFLVVGVLVGALAGRMRDREAARPGPRAGERRAQPAQRGGGLADVHRADGRDLPRRDRRPARRRARRRSTWSGTAALVSYREAPPAPRRRPVRRRPRRARLPSGGAEAAGEPAASPAGDGGLYVPVRSPSGVTGVLTVQARGDGRPYGPARRAPGHVARQHGRRVPRARAAAAGRHLRRGRPGGRPPQVQPALVRLPRAQDPAGRADGHGEQPARERRRLGRGERARRAARHRGRRGAPQQQHHAPCSSCRGSRPTPGSRGASSTGSARSSFAGIDALPAHLQERVRVDLPDEDIVVDVDFVQFTRVIQNLLENALLYTDGAVTVGARGWNEGVRLWVEDQGPGIPADEHEAVFEKFFRGRKPAGQRGPSGTGPRPRDRAGDRARARRHDRRRRRGAARRAVRDHAAGGHPSRSADRRGGGA